MQVARAVNAGRKKSNILVNIALTVLIIYLLCVFTNLYIKINEKKNTISDQDIQISSKTAEKEKLTAIHQADVDDEYVEEIAREKAGFVKPNEKVYESITD